MTGKKFKHVKFGDRVKLHGGFTGKVISVLTIDPYLIVVQFSPDWTEKYSLNGFPRRSGACIKEIIKGDINE